MLKIENYKSATNWYYTDGLRIVDVLEENNYYLFVIDAPNEMQKIHFHIFRKKNGDGNYYGNYYALWKGRGIEPLSIDELSSGNLRQLIAKMVYKNSI